MILTVIAVLVISCTNPAENGNEVHSKKPGQFSASLVSDNSLSDGARNVSLGIFPVSNSRSIYFILRNIGDFPITNITLTAGKLLSAGGTFETIADNGVVVSPVAITSLDPINNSTVNTF